MTRETKIGLLVGLAFIIVIGILLSDHLTSTTEPQQASLVIAGGNVRSGVTVPGASSAAPATTVAQNTQHVVPQQPVPTREELTPRKPPVEIVQIGQAPQPSRTQQESAESNTQVAQATNANSQTSLSAEQGVTGIDSNSPAIARNNGPSNTGSLANIAKGMGEEIVPANGQNNSSNNSSSPSSANKTAGTNVVSSADDKQYTATAGDSLSKIASKFYGNGRKANCDLIIAANPSLQANPNLIMAGQTYIIPQAGANASAMSGKTPHAQQSESANTQTAQKNASQQPTSSPEYFYTVKSGDTLTRISLEELGNAEGVEAIKDLNQDVLKGGDVIRPNMKLRLPTKPLASAQ